MVSGLFEKLEPSVEELETYPSSCRPLVLNAGLALIGLCIVSACEVSSVHCASGHDYIVEIDSVASIANPDSWSALPVEAQIGHPVQLDISADHSLYVADAAFMTIKEYDSTGTFQRTLGDRGRGPGEFLDFTSMHISGAGDTILISDEFNERITYLGLDNNETRTISYAETDILFPRQTFELDGGDLLFLYRVSSGDLANPDSLNIFHVYNRNLTAKQLSFGNVSAFLPSGSFPDVISYLHPGMFRVRQQREVIFAPRIYSGTLFIYDLQQGGALAGTYTSRIARTEPYEEVPRDREPRPLGAILVSGIKQTAGVIRSQTVGLFIDDNDQVTHVAAILCEDEWHYFEEVFDSDGVSRGVGYLRDVSGVDVLLGISTLQFCAMPIRGQYYVADIANGTVEAIYTRRGQ